VETRSAKSRRENYERIAASFHLQQIEAARIEEEREPITEEELKSDFAKQVLSRIERDILEDYMLYNISTELIIQDLSKYDSLTRSLRAIYNF
jgi:hypothetical protein